MLFCTRSHRVLKSCPICSNTNFFFAKHPPCVLDIDRNVDQVRKNAFSLHRLYFIFKGII